MEELSSLIAELREQEALVLVKKLLGEGKDPLAILELCRKGMEEVGEKFENGEYFVADLMMAAEIFNEVLAMVKPLIGKKADRRVGRIVLGTVKDDIHDIGKNIFKSLAEANGFEVYDLGVDVPPEAFVEKVKELKPEIVGMSCLLTTAFESMKATVEALEKAGLRSKVKIIIGGSPVTSEVARWVGADAFTTSAHEGVKRCKEMVGL